MKSWCFCALLISILLFYGCQTGEREPKGQPLTLSLAVQPVNLSGLIAIADAKGYFKEAGLEVALNLYPSGSESLEAVCRGKAQVGTVADIAFATKALENPSIRVLASIATTVGSQIVARKDRDIQNPRDLLGKKIASSSGTVTDYFLYAFLAAENISLKDVKLVDVPAIQQADSVVTGKVDVVSAFEIYAYEARKRLGSNAVAWDSQGFLAYHWLLAAQESAVESPEPLKRLLKGLIKAEDFALANEKEAKSIISQMWNFDPSFIEQAWSRTRLNVSLGQSIVTSLENYTRWRLRITGKAEDPPDIIDFLHTRTLDEISPGIVDVHNRRLIHEGQK